jgi:phosphate transport system substrate-binding protein
MQDIKMSRRHFLGVIGSAGVLVGLGLTGCGSSSTSSSSDSSSTTNKSVTGSVTAVGSTALQPLAEAVAEQFMTVYPNVTITVQGGGSGTGLSQISQGSVQIGDSDIFAEKKLSSADAAKLIDNKVCVVGMGPIVNKDVTITNISMTNLKKIFTGDITNWKDVGGSDETITVINRASGSGTRATFENAVLAGDSAPSTFTPQEVDSSGTVATMVANTPGAISYVAFSYFADSFNTLDVDGVAPEATEVTTNAWPIWSYEHMYTSSSPDTATQTFIDYMLSDDVQDSLVVDNGYIQISTMKVSMDSTGTITKL